MSEKKEREFLEYFLSVLITLFLLAISISNLDVDRQGFLSLAFVIALITVFSFVTNKSLKDLVNLLKNVNFTYGLPLILLAGITFFGFWLTVRLVGYFAYNYLFNDGFNYTQYQIFQMVSFILATRLCLTLFETIKKDATAKNEDKHLIRTGYLDTAIQAVIISIITVLPNYGNSDILARFGDTQTNRFLGFLFLLITLVMMLLILLYARKKFANPESPL